MDFKIGDVVRLKEDIYYGTDKETEAHEITGLKFPGWTVLILRYSNESSVVKPSTLSTEPGCLSQIKLPQVTSRILLA